MIRIHQPFYEINLVFRRLGPALHSTARVLSLVLHMAMKRRKETNLSESVKVIKLVGEGRSAGMSWSNIQKANISTKTTCLM